MGDDYLQALAKRKAKKDYEGRDAGSPAPRDRSNERAEVQVHMAPIKLDSGESKLKIMDIKLHHSPQTPEEEEAFDKEYAKERPGWMQMERDEEKKKRAYRLSRTPDADTGEVER